MSCQGSEKTPSVTVQAAAGKAPGGQSSVRGAAPLRRGAAPLRRRLIGLLGVLFVIASYWIFKGDSANVPEVPAIDLTGADPDVAETIKKTRAAVVAAPRSADAWGRLGMILHSHGSNDTALICYMAAGALDP